MMQITRSPAVHLTCVALLGGLVHEGCGKQRDPNPIVFRSADGKTLTMEDLRGFTGTIRWEIASANVPQEATSLHDQARRAGAAGDYGEAIALLKRAATIAPQWPYPFYDMAYTFLLAKDADNARTYYRKTLELAPRGFFTAITALDTLERERTGDLPAGTYRAYLSLESLADPQEKADLLRRLTAQIPRFAPAWKDLASMLKDTERLSAIEKGLAAAPDAETKGMLLVNKALVLNAAGDRNGAIKLLGELALDPNSTYGTEHWAKASLALIAMQKTP
jgi:tetratricopeptide (TPR) repeat protein